mmetsp:Transcript_36338/g.26965  ORF Transcript_36338/g.26965 Transcript_36338/m.26965 type:complete len:137 (+) Transcript_36338:175-585(+)
MYGSEFIDGPANIQRVDVHEIHPMLGSIDIYEVIDYTSQKATVVSSSTPCASYNIPYKINLMDLFNAFNDPESGLVEYQGLKTVSWDDAEYHVFLLHQPLSIDFDYDQIFYADEAGIVHWAEIPSSGWIMKMNGGF